MTDAAFWDKIEALMTLAARAGTQGEAEAATAGIHRLLLKHNLTMLDAERRVGNAPAKSGVVQREMWVSRERWRSGLYAQLASANMCRVLQARNRDGSYVYVIGHRQNVEAVERLYELYEPLVERIPLTIEIPYGESTLSYRTGFRNGMVDGIGARLREEMDQAERNDSQSSALVPLLKKEVDTWVDQKHGRLRKDTPTRTRYRSAYHSGYSVGKSLEARKEVKA